MVLMEAMPVRFLPALIPFSLPHPILLPVYKFSGLIRVTVKKYIIL